MKKVLLTILFSLLTFSVFAESGMMLRTNSPSLKQKTDKGMAWAMEIPYGTKLDVISTETVTANYYWDGGSQKNVEFYAVKYKGKEYYAKKDEFVVGDKFAVINENATLFTNPKPASFRNAFLEPGSLILVTGKSTNFGNVRFTEVLFYDTNESTIKTRWIQTSKYSDSEKDIKTAQLVKLALSQKDEGLKKEFISSAVELGASSKIANYAQAVYDKIFKIGQEVEVAASSDNITSFTDDEITSTSFNASIYTLDGANVNIRNAPGTAGEKIGQLENGTKVSVSLCTTRNNTFEGITAPWYFVTTEDGNLSGWIFGGYTKE